MSAKSSKPAENNEVDKVTDDNLSLQQKLTNLNELVDWFNADDFALEEAVERFKRADALAREIEADLAKIKNEITVLSERFDDK